MAFGKKKTVVSQFTQESVAMLASQALAKKRSTLVRLALRLRGETPLLTQRWSQKAITQMLGKMVGQPQPKEAKDLTEDFKNSYYRNLDEVPVIPCRIIKACIIEGAITTQGVVTKMDLKRGLRLIGYTAPLREAKMKMDARIVTVNGGSPDMRSRAVFDEGWYVDVVLQFATTITPDQIMAAVEGAGSAIGLCEWRPEKGGDYGCFSVEVLQDKEIARILKECSIPEKEYEIPPEFLRAFKAGETGATSDSASKAKAVVEKVNGDAEGKRARKNAKSNGATTTESADAE